MDDEALKDMVASVLRKAVVNDADMEESMQIAEMERDPSLGTIGQAREHPDAEKAKQLNDLTADLGDTDTRGDEIDSHMRTTQGRGEQSFDPRWADEQGIVFADDFMDEDEAVMLDEHGQLGTIPLSAHSRAKWTISGMPVQCSECFR